MRYVEFRLIGSEWVPSAEHQSSSRRKVMLAIRKDAKETEKPWNGIIKVRQDDETAIVS